MRIPTSLAAVVFITLAIGPQPARPDPLAPKTVTTGEHRITVQRLSANPIISYGSSETLGTKINGPSLISAPEWLPSRLGNYYLYFAHHDGKYIRLAYADRIQGPWTVYEPGTLTLEQSPAFIGHIASPDVHVDSQSREIRMYYHGSRESENQKTAIARSKDGIHFHVANETIGSAYFRVFEHGGEFYSIDAHGFLNHSPRSDVGWQISAKPLVAPISVEDAFGKRDDVRIRHSAVWVKEDTLFLFYTRKSDAPERVLVSEVALKGDWTEWSASPPVELLRPETSYEGIQYANQPSKKGGAVKVQQLRDPCIFHDSDGQSYLLYSIAGEMGLAIARISIESR